MKTRILSVFAALLLLAGVLSGCGRGANEPAPTPEPTATPEPTPDPHEGMVEVTDGAGGTMWVDEAKYLRPFPLDRTLFSVTDGKAAYAGEGYTLLRGIDVSEHNQSVDWVAVRESGVEFVILRCGWRGYGGGSLNEDALFRENYEGAKAAGLRVGAYFFSQAISLMEAAEEAVFTAKILQGCELDLPVYFDWEIIGTEPARTDGTDARTVTEATLEFCRLIASEGYTPGVYTYIPKVYTLYALDSLQGLDLWLGDPGSWPEFYYDHSIWQYSFTGTVPGIEGDVDMDVLYVSTTESEAVG